jgi:uncharacterized protein YndB with AHSA1/START domain
MTPPVHAIAMHRFGVSAERVFDTCLDPAWVGRWMFGPVIPNEQLVRLTLEPRVGGKFSFVTQREGGTEVEHIGEYLAVDRPSLLVFKWATRDHPADVSRVVIEISPCDEGCDVKLTQVMGANWSAFVDRAANAWSQMLDALERAIRQDRVA